MITQEGLARVKSPEFAASLRAFAADARAVSPEIVRLMLLGRVAIALCSARGQIIEPAEFREFVDAHNREIIEALDSALAMESDLAGVCWG